MLKGGNLVAKKKRDTLKELQTKKDADKHQKDWFDGTIRAHVTQPSLETQDVAAFAANKAKRLPTGTRIPTPTYPQPKPVPTTRLPAADINSASRESAIGQTAGARQRPISATTWRKRATNLAAQAAEIEKQSKDTVKHLLPAGVGVGRVILSDKQVISNYDNSAHVTVQVDPNEKPQTSVAPHQLQSNYESIMKIAEETIPDYSDGSEDGQNPQKDESVDDAQTSINRSSSFNTITTVTTQQTMLAPPYSPSQIAAASPVDAPAALGSPHGSSPLSSPKGSLSGMQKVIDFLQQQLDVEKEKVWSLEQQNLAARQINLRLQNEVQLMKQHKVKAMRATAEIKSLKQEITNLEEERDDMRKRLVEEKKIQLRAAVHAKLGQTGGKPEILQFKTQYKILCKTLVKKLYTNAPMEQIELAEKNFMSLYDECEPYVPIMEKLDGTVHLDPVIEHLNADSERKAVHVLALAEWPRTSNLWDIAKNIAATNVDIQSRTCGSIYGVLQGCLPLEVWSTLQDKYVRVIKRVQEMEQPVLVELMSNLKNIISNKEKENQVLQESLAHANNKPATQYINMHNAADWFSGNPGHPGHPNRQRNHRHRHKHKHHHYHKKKDEDVTDLASDAYSNSNDDVNTTYSLSSPNISPSEDSPRHRKHRSQKHRHHRKVHSRQKNHPIRETKASTKTLHEVETSAEISTLNKSKSKLKLSNMASHNNNIYRQDPAADYDSLVELLRFHTIAVGPQDVVVPLYEANEIEQKMGLV